MIICETDRLRLEILDESHFENLVELLANPIVHRFWPEPKTKDREGSRKFFNRIQTMYEQYGYSFWAVVRKEDNQFLGLCGLLPDEFEGTPEVEVGYRLDNRFRGNGYAPEAAKACMEYAREQLGWNTVISLILPENTPSIRVAQKNGLVPSGEKYHNGLNHIVWRKRWEQ